MATEPYFSLATPASAIVPGQIILDSSVTEAYNGYLLTKKPGATTAILSTGSPIGMLYESLALIPFPTSGNIAATTNNNGLEVGVLMGEFEAVCNGDLFASGTLPGQLGLVYDNGASGLLTATQAAGKSLVGRVVGLITRMASGLSAGSNTNTENLVAIKFEFDSINNSDPTA